jgi:hypothetical protein
VRPDEPQRRLTDLGKSLKASLPGPTPKIPRKVPQANPISCVRAPLPHNCLVGIFDPAKSDFPSRTWASIAPLPGFICRAGLPRLSAPLGRFERRLIKK